MNPPLNRLYAARIGATLGPLFDGLASAQVAGTPLVGKHRSLARIAYNQSAREWNRTAKGRAYRDALNRKKREARAVGAK